MKKVLLLIVITLSLMQVSFGQVSGTFTIPGAPYATIAAAISALNTQGVGVGGATFNVTAGYTETFASPAAGLITTTTGSATNPIVFQKSGAGANPLVTAGTGTGTYDYIFCIGGTDYITFDGISVQENAANTTTAQQMEWGYAILKASATDGSQNITIRNCAISLNKANTATYAIYSNNWAYTAPGTTLTVTAVTGANSNNHFYNNTISNVYGGIYLNGFADVTSPYAYYDQGNDIGSVTGNTFSNFAGGASTAYVIYMAYQNNLLVANSNISGGAGQTGALYGIYGSTATNASASIYANTVTLVSGGTTGYMYGIYNSGIGTGGTTNTLGIYNNTIQNCTYPTITTAYFYGIYNGATAFTINMYGNTVNNNTIAGSGYMYLFYTTSVAGGTCNVYNNTVSNNLRTGTGTQSGTSVFYCMYVVGSGTTSIHDNNIFGNVIGSTTIIGPTYGGGIYSLYCSNSAPQQSVYNNSIHDQTINTSYTSSNYMYGIYSFPASTSTGSLYNNNIYNMSINETGTGYGYIYGLYSYYGNAVYSNNLYNITVSNTSTGYGYGYGYYIPGSTQSVNFYKNRLYGVSMAGASGYFYGVYISSGVTMNLYNNYISDLKTPASTSTGALYGVYISGGTTVNLYYNTIYLNATSTSATTFGTSGVYASTTPTVDMRNNIIINTSTAPASTTYSTAAYRRSSTTVTTYAATANSNDFYAGTPSTTNLIYTDGTNTAQTLAAYKTLMSPRETSSITEIPPFVNIATTPYNLHLQTTVATQCESGGTNISSPSITVDYDNDARYPNPGYPVGGFTPVASDIGADEFGGLYLDATPPSIVYTPFLNTNSTAARVLTTSISDASGVPTIGTGVPRLYWRINAGAWNNVAGVFVSGSTYTFTFGAGVVMNDVVSYYIVAQDSYSPPNIIANPSAGASGYTTNPPACSTPPTTPNSYIIVPTLCGVKTVGTGGDYTNLTAAAAAINLSEFSCPVVLSILSTYSSAGETFPIVFNANPGSSTTNTLTIKPAATVTATITGAVSGPILKILNPNTIIDGSNTVSGTTRDLTISNTGATTPQVLILGSTGTTPITNVTLKNSVIINGVNSSSAMIVSDGTAPGTAGYFNNITIQNNSFQLAYIALYCIANAAPGNGSGLLITGNDFNTSGANSIRLVGVYVQGVDGVTVSNNNIGNFANTADASNITGIWFATGTVNGTISGNTISTLSGTSSAPRGIAVSAGVLNSNNIITGNTITGITTTVGSSTIVPTGIYIFTASSNISVTRNRINNIKYTGTSGYGARGLDIATGTAASNMFVANNVIYDVLGDGDATFESYGIVGIMIRGGSGGIEVYHNSINLYGNITVGTYTPNTAAFYSGSTSTALNVRDNIFVNSITKPSTAGAKAYSIYNAGTNAVYTSINYNDYFVSGTQGVLGYLGGDRTTLAAWQTATGQDAGSLNADPVFVSSTDLHPTNAALNNLGIYIPTVSVDYSGALRTNPPDMGAYEFGADPVVNTTAASGITNVAATLNGTINAASLSVNSFFDYGLTTAYGTSTAGLPATVTGSTTTPISLGISGLTGNTLYHYRARGVAGGLTIYGPDMTFTTLPDPPAVVTVAASAITVSGATLNGTVNANGSSTTVTFQYGLTVAYGTTIAATPGTVTGNSVTAVNGPITGLLPNTQYHFRVVGVNAGGTSYGGDLTFTTLAQAPNVVTNAASNIGTTTAQLNGTVTANNSNTTVSFDWGLTAAYGNNAAATPATVTGMTPTAVLANISGLLTNTTYHFRCVGVNAGGPTYGLDQTFLSGCPPVGPAGTITGPTSVCANSTGKVYTIAAIVNATGYAWTVPAGAIITNGNNTTSITVTFGTTSGNVSVYGTGPCGNGAPNSLAVTVNPLPVPTISGPATACQGTTSNIYTTQASMTGYAWTVSAGGTITAGQGTSAVTVTWNASGAQSLGVSYTNGNGCASASPGTYNVTVNAAPTPTVSGPTSMCVNSGFYNYSTQSGFTNYVWTISAGGTITFGQGTSQAQVTWNQAGAQWVAVNYTNANGCSAPAAVSLPVTVNPMPGAAGTITGTSAVCGGATGIAYSCAPVANAVDYVWTLPAGASISSGSGTNAIIVDFAPDASSGDITVYGNNLCGNGTPSPAFPVTVTALPGAAGTITGQTAICQGTSGVIYTVPAIANATGYVWTAPSGATIVAGQNTASITVDFGLTAVSGNVTVYGTNTCGNGTASGLAVTVNPIPATPLITLNMDILSSDATSGNQWYYEGSPIAGATAQTYQATQSGWYWNVVTLYGCSSDSSNNIYVVITGLNELAGGNVNIYPVPNDGRFTLSIVSPKAQTYRISVFSNIGVLVREIPAIEVKGTAQQVIDLRPVPDGIYTVVIQSDNGRTIRKIIVNK